MDIDKQPPVFRAKDGRMYYKVEMTDYDELIDRLYTVEAHNQHDEFYATRRTEDIDKKITEWLEEVTAIEHGFYPDGFAKNPVKAGDRLSRIAREAINQLKACREELKDRCEDLEFEYNGRIKAEKEIDGLEKIEQRTQDAIREYLKLGLSELFVSAFGIKPQSDKLPLWQEELSEWVDRAIDSVGGK